MLLNGKCHCGQIEVSFETALPLDEIDVRACQCTFCRRHGAKTVTDPNGQLTILSPPGALSHYQFGLRTADYLLCKTCGVYVAAMISDGVGERATLNVNGMRIDGLWDRDASPIEFDHEDKGSRRDRRHRYWTPARIVTTALRRSG